MFLHCDHFRENTQQGGKISIANRYSILGWSHDDDRISYFYNDKQMLKDLFKLSAVKGNITDHDTCGCHCDISVSQNWYGFIPFTITETAQLELVLENILVS
jgi:hypothetical protein